MKKSRKKALVLSILGVVVSFTLTGCIERKAEGIKDRRIALKYTNMGHKDYNEFRKAEAKKFEKLHPDVTVKYEPIAENYQTKILTQIVGGNVADVFVNEDVITLARKGAILDLTPYMEKDKKYFDQIYPQLIEFSRYKGGIYGLPSNLNTEVLYYNKKLFDEAGLSYPDESWTWDTMVRAAKKLTKRDTRGVTIHLGVLGPQLITVWKTFRQNGGNIWDEDKSKCIVNSPENAEALQLCKDLIEKHRVSSIGLEVRGEGRWETFVAGRVGMVYGGRWLTALCNRKKDLSWGVAPLPKLKNRDSWASFNALSVSSTTKHPELAYKLVKFLIRPEGIEASVDLGDSIPIRWSREANDYFLNDPQRPENENQVYLDAMKHAFTEKWMYHPDMPYQRQRAIMREETERFLVTAGVSAEKTLKNLQDRLNTLLREAEKE